MIRYSPDTCDCVIIVDPQFSRLETWEQKCQIHKNINDNALLNVILAHNKGHNNPTQTRLDTITKKANERKRIRDLGAPIRNES